MPDQQLKDPLNRQITLHDRTWYGHIIKGHPEVALERTRVEQAILSPEEIQFSASDADCRLYYGMATAPGRRLAVVVDVLNGMVKTAYATRTKKAGKIEWSR